MGEPRAAGRVDGLPFVGRASALDTLLGAVGSVDPAGCLAVVSGEAGIGKTRLLDELAQALPDEVLVLRGSSHDSYVALPYAPFAEALEDACRQLGLEKAAALFARQAPVLSRLAPSLAEWIRDGPPSPPALNPAEEQVRLFDAVAQALRELTRHHRVVLRLDDLHWADAATCSMLRHVVGLVPSTALAVIVSYRDDEITRNHGLAGVLADTRSFVPQTRLRLSGLDAAAVEELAHAIGNHDVSAALVATVARSTGGNPFFVREVLLHSEHSVPLGVRAVVQQRFARLGDDALRLLTTAAVCPGPFLFDVVAQASSLGEDDAMNALEAALRARVVRECDRGPRYEFAHALLRDVLRDRVTLSRRVHLHRQLAVGLLEGRPTEVEEIAEHFHASGALAGAQVGAPYARDAADAAFAAQAFDRAAHFYEVALDLEPHDVGLRSRCSAGLARARALIGDPAAVQSALYAAELLTGTDDNDAAVGHLVDVIDDLSDVGRLSHARPVVERALGLLGGVHDHRWAQLQMLANDDELGIPHLPEALLDDVVGALARLPLHRRIGVGLPVRNRAEASALGHDDPLRLAFSIGDFRKAIRVAIPWAERFEEEGRLGRALLMWAVVGRSHQALGNVRSGGDALRRAVALGDRMSGHGGHYLNVTAGLDERTILLDDGHERSLAAQLSFIESGDREVQYALIPIVASASRTMAALGQSAEPIALVGRVLPVLESAPPYAANFTRTVCDVASTLWMTRRPDHLDVVEQVLREKVLVADLRYPMFDARLSLARLCALAGRFDDAEEWFSAARAVLLSQGARPLLAIADYDECTALRMRDRRSDRDRANLLFASAVAMFETLGMRGWLARARRPDPDVPA